MKRWKNAEKIHQVMCVIYIYIISIVIALFIILPRSQAIVGELLNIYGCIIVVVVLMRFAIVVIAICPCINNIFAIPNPSIRSSRWQSVNKSIYYRITQGISVLMLYNV